MLHTVLLAAAIATTGLAPQDAPTQAAPAAQDESIIVKGAQRARDKRVCKRSVSTGSIMTKAICKTAGEWEIERERNIAQLELLRQRGLIEGEGRREHNEEQPPRAN